MSRIVAAALALVLVGSQPVLAEGTTPPARWMLVIKQTIKEKLKAPEYLSFGRIFYVDKKNADGAVPVCGFANFKQKKTDHATRQPFHGLFKPSQDGSTGDFASIQMAETAAQAADIATACKNDGIY